MAAKTLANLRTRVRRYIGDTSSDTTKQRFLNAAVDDAINDKIEELAIDGLLKKDTATDTVVTGDTTYTFPTDAWKVYRIAMDDKYIVATSMAELDDWKRDWDNDDNGEPRLWYPTTARNYKFYPPSASAYNGKTIDLYYYDIPAAMSTTTESPDLANEYHVAIAYGASALLLQADRRNDEAGNWEARFGVFKQKAIKDLRRAEDRARRYVMEIDRGATHRGTTINPLDAIYRGD
jgi:hypothetical protein